MRVLVVSSFPPRHCGIGAYARDQASRLREEGHEVVVLSPPDGDGDVKAPFLGGRAFSKAASLAPGFDRVIVHFQPALYYRPRAPLAKILTSARLLRLAWRGRRNVEILVHEADPRVRWRPDYALLRLAFRAAPRVLFHTEAEREAFESEYGLRTRGRIVEHRVAAAAPPVSKEEARRRLGLTGAGGPLFVCAGFLQPSKGFDRAVRAFAGAGGGSMFLVGSVREPTRENLDYVGELRGICDRTPGATLVERFVEDAEFDLWLLAADWTVLPYRRSWSSGVLARARVLGTPAIVAAEGGLAQQAGPGDVVVGDDEELAAAVRERVTATLGAKR